MQSSRAVLCLVAVLFVPLCTDAQKVKREPLTEAQVEKIREASIDPNQRILLYTQYANEHAETLKSVAERPKSPARSKRLDDELQDFTALLDELASNLDQYGERKADMRPALKKLHEICPKWLDILKAMPVEPMYDEARKEAMQSWNDLAEDARELLKEQDEYFVKNKKGKGQERQEPE
jgi:hypothetical protein